MEERQLPRTPEDLKTVCPYCEARHAPIMSHDPHSFAYQSWFFKMYGRLPSWRDASEHCPPEFQDMARGLTKLYGIDFDAPADLLWPDPGERKSGPEAD